MATKRERFGYHSVRCGDKVTKQFYGASADPVGQLIHRDRRLDMAIKTAKRSLLAAETQACKASEHYLQLLDTVVSKWKRLNAISQRFPFHPFHLDGVSTDETDEPSDRLRENLDMTVPAQRIHDLLQRADRGDSEAEETLNQLIERYHDVVSDAFDLVAITRDLRLASLAGESKATRKLAEAWFDDISRRLDKQHASDALEALLIDVVSVNYVDAMWCAAISARATETQRQAQFWSKMSTQSVNRLANVLAALKALRSRKR